MVHWATSFHLRIWKHYHPLYLMSFFHYYFPPKMMILAEPNSHERWRLALVQPSHVGPTARDGPGVANNCAPVVWWRRCSLRCLCHQLDALGPGEASAPRLTSRTWIYCWSHLLTMIHGNVIKESCFVSSSDRNWSFAQHTTLSNSVNILGKWRGVRYVSFFFAFSADVCYF